jgi:hypothetical protein
MRENEALFLLAGILTLVWYLKKDSINTTKTKESLNIPISKPIATQVLDPISSLEALARSKETFITLDYIETQGGEFVRDSPPQLGLVSNETT